MKRPPLFLSCALLALSTVTLGGCLGVRLKQMEINQLNSELTDIDRISKFVEQDPQLGNQYDGRIVLSDKPLNTFLGGLSNYQIPLEAPKGAVITIESVRLDFRDGPPAAEITASAVDKSGLVNVKLRVRADLLISGSPSDSSLHIRLVAREILPDVKVSIFRLRELWFVWDLMRLKADQFASSLPDLTVPIHVDLPIDLSPPGNAEMQIGDAVMYLNQSLPSVSVGYSVSVKDAITLHDGVHVFFSVVRTY